MLNLFFTTLSELYQMYIEQNTKIFNVLFKLQNRFRQIILYMALNTHFLTDIWDIWYILKVLEVWGFQISLYLYQYKYLNRVLKDTAKKPRASAHILPASVSTINVHDGAITRTLNRLWFKRIARRKSLAWEHS